MKALHFLLFLLLLINIPLFAQPTEFNLKNLDSLSIRFDDSQNLISSTLKQKIITETKLKLKSAGIEIAKYDSSNNHLVISVQAIMSKFAEHRILLQIRVFENVQTFRKDNTKTKAITYYDESFFKSKNIGQAVYNELMDKLLIGFFERYLTSN